MITLFNSQQSTITPQLFPLITIHQRLWRFFLSGSSFSFFASRDTGEQHDLGGRLSGSILTEGRLERQFSVSDLG